MKKVTLDIVLDHLENDTNEVFVDEELAQYFKGKKINSGRFGGSPNLCVRYLLLSIGLDPDKDVVMVEPADMSTSVAVVQSGQADIS